MKWNIILGSVVLTFALCTQSFGFGHRMNACGCDTACDTCGCEPTCGAASGDSAPMPPTPNADSSAYLNR